MSIDLLYIFLKKYWNWLIAGLLPVAVFLIVNPNYLLGNTFFYACLFTLPFSFNRGGQGMTHLFSLALVVALLSIFLPTTIGVYAMMCIMVLFLLERLQRNPNFLVLIHLLLLSPLFSYFSTLISFPARMYLSEVVSFILKTAGYNIQIDGNMVSMDGVSFLVDQACSGLQMLGYGLLFGTLILSYLSQNKNVSILRLIGYYSLLIGLIIIGNAIRIILLIVFVILPEHWLHEGLGLIIYAFQILLPFFLIVRHSLRKFQFDQALATTQTGGFPVKRYALLLGLFVMILYQRELRNVSVRNYENIKLDGYLSETLPSGTIKIYNDSSLIYIKPPVPAYNADHNPMICWKGSGYKFRKLEQWNTGTTMVNFAELEKGKDKLFTTWWFESTHSRTASQWHWRKLNLISDEQFHLVNITCNSRSELEQQLHKIQKQSLVYSTSKR